MIFFFASVVHQEVNNLSKVAQGRVRQIWRRQEKEQCWLNAKQEKRTYLFASVRSDRRNPFFFLFFKRQSGKVGCSLFSSRLVSDWVFLLFFWKFCMIIVTWLLPSKLWCLTSLAICKVLECQQHFFSFPRFRPCFAFLRDSHASDFIFEYFARNGVFVMHSNP